MESGRAILGAASRRRRHDGRHPVRFFMAAVALAALSACQTAAGSAEGGDGKRLVWVSSVTPEAESAPPAGGGETLIGGGTPEADDKKPDVKERISWDLYTPFYDEADHLESLLDEGGKVDDAAQLYVEQEDYFTENREKHGAVLARLAAALNGRKEPALAEARATLEAVRWPAAVSEWTRIRNDLRAAERTLLTYPDHPILKIEAFASPEAGRLAAAIEDLTRRIEATAASDFGDFDHFGARSFFTIYPVYLDPIRFTEKHYAAIAPKLEAAGTGDLAALAGNYGEAVFGAERWGHIGGLFVAAHLRERGRSDDGGLVDVLTAVKAAKAAGFNPKAVPGLKIGFVEVTSKSLLKHGQIEFPATVDVDLPVEAVKADLDDALTNATARAADYLIVFDVALAKAKRRVTAKKTMPSKILVGHRTEPNPAYAMAQNEVNVAQLRVQEAALNSASNSGQSCYGVGCVAMALSGVLRAAGRMVANNELDKAMAKLRGTPLTIEVPIYKGYNYDLASIKARKLMTVHYYVIDRRRGTYFKSTFDVDEKHTFEVAYRIHEDDPDRNAHIADASKEEDVVAWEEAATSVKLSQLVNHYLANAGQSKKLPALAALRRDMLADKNTALAEYQANTYDARPLNDPRFDSVVVVYTGEGSLGSGFFIEPDVVLTNWHVVENQKFVELKMYDGQETFGKTIVSDVRLDLALIKVQSRGKPVRFYTQRTLDLGATVEAIGHPKGLEFSITRGIISAVRGDRNFATARTVGGGEVLFIQTDAPVNSGNSGGPLFLGDLVIGVNSQAYKKDVAEGLNFAIHYSEVLEFLKDNLPGYRPAGS